MEQEEHVRQCLEGGSGQGPATSRYLVYRLPAESALLGVECESMRSFTTILITDSPNLHPGVICLEEFVKGGWPKTFFLQLTDAMIQVPLLLA